MTNSETVCVSIAGEVTAVSQVPTKEKTAASSRLELQTIAYRGTTRSANVKEDGSACEQRLDHPTANTNECQPPSCLLVAISVAPLQAPK